MEHTFSVESTVSGYHEYQYVWDAPVHEVLSCKREVGNVYNTFVVAVKKDDKIVGHCPRNISAICIRCGGKITRQVTGRRRYSSDLPQGDLEIPCKLMFHTKKKSKVDKTAKLIKNALSKNITNTETAVDVNFSNCPTSASKSQHSSASVSFASIN